MKRNKEETGSQCSTGHSKHSTVQEQINGSSCTQLHTNTFGLITLIGKGFVLS